MRPSVGREPARRLPAQSGRCLPGAAIILAHDLLSYDLGPQARHMILHIVAMNIVAPLLAALVVTLRPERSARARWLWFAATIPGSRALGIARAGGSSPGHDQSCPWIGATHGILLCRPWYSGCCCCRCRMHAAGMRSRLCC